MKEIITKEKEIMDDMISKLYLDNSVFIALADSLSEGLGANRECIEYALREVFQAGYESGYSDGHG